MNRSENLKLKGEKHFENYCLKNGLNYIKSTKNQDLYDGFDYLIDNKRIDVKYTPHIYFLNYDINKKSFLTRHPFLKNTKATHYYFIDLKLIAIDDYLKKFIKDINGFKIFLQEINLTAACNLTYEKKKVKNLEQAMLIVKKELNQYLLNNSIINYEKSIRYNNQECYTFKIITKKII